MEISRSGKKLRYLLNPSSLFFTSQCVSKTLSTVNPTCSILPATQIPNPHLTSNSESSFAHSTLNYIVHPSVYIPHIISRSYSTSSLYSFQLKSQVSREKSDFLKSGSRNQERIQEIMEVIQRDENDMENELNKMGLALSLDLISELFVGLNAGRFSGLRFFKWVREKQVHFCRNSVFCSLAIDNLGRIEDYNSMFLTLKDFSREKLCLTEKAFAFLPVFNSNLALLRGYVIKVIEMLNEVGGSCRNSGIFALIKLLCTLNSFDMAMFVMEETARKTSYYNVLIWAKCRSCDFQEAHDLFDEMKRFGCDPNANSYNYLLGSLCKNSRTAEVCKLFEKMEEFGYHPDTVTFEVIIHHACRLGRLDSAVEFLNQMMSRGIEPRHTTHAVIIKSYFYCNRFQEAYEYVVDMCDKCKCSGNMNYSLLASLLQKSKLVVEAREILVDMIDKGLKPNFPVYMKVMKDLHKSGMGHLVADLKSRFSKFNSRTKAV